MQLCIVNAHWPVGCPRDTTRQCVSTSSSLEAVRYNPEMLMRKNVWKYTFECSLNTLHKSMYFKFALAHIGRKDTLVYVCLFVCQFVCPFLTVLCLCLFVSLFVCQFVWLFVVCCTYPVCARLLQGRGLQVSLFVCIP